MRHKEGVKLSWKQKKKSVKGMVYDKKKQLYKTYGKKRKDKKAR